MFAALISYGRAVDFNGVFIRLSFIITKGRGNNKTYKGRVVGTAANTWQVNCAVIVSILGKCIIKKGNLLSKE